MKKIFFSACLFLTVLYPILAEEDAMTITSTAFGYGRPIPKQYSCKGADLSPPVEWTCAPEAAVSFVLICDDPDAPVGNWVHWVYFNIPEDTTRLAEGFPAGAEPPKGGIQGRNSWNRNDYGGPCPPGGTHRYYFRLYALDTMLNLDASADKRKVEAAMKGHILSEAELMGTFTK